MESETAMNDTKGFSILINGVERTFRDLRETADSAARELKKRHRTDRVEIVDRSTGQKTVVGDDGRMH